MAPAPLSIGAVHLHHQNAFRTEEPREARTVAPSALDADMAERPEAAEPGEQATIALSRRRERCRPEQAPRGANRRGQVEVLVRVDSPKLVWPDQVTYELIRPVVLFGLSPAERAKQTGVPERTIYRRADRFDTEGMASVFASARAAAPRALPPGIRRAIVELKAEHRALRPYELAAICYVRFGYRPRPHTFV